MCHTTILQQHVHTFLSHNTFMPENALHDLCMYCTHSHKMQPCQEPPFVDKIRGGTTPVFKPLR